MPRGKKPAAVSQEQLPRMLYNNCRNSFGTDTFSSNFPKLDLPLLENSVAVLFNTSLEKIIFPGFRTLHSTLTCLL